jgi:hypothetical protein
MLQDKLFLIKLSVIRFLFVDGRSFTCVLANINEFHHNNWTQINCDIYRSCLKLGAVASGSESDKLGRHFSSLPQQTPQMPPNMSGGKHENKTESLVTSKTWRSPSAFHL